MPKIDWVGPAGGAWQSIHSHWSFTRHQAFQTMTAEATEGLSD